MTKRIIQYIFSGICCLLTVAACLEEKDPLNYSPAVTTGGVTNIGYTNATLAGAIRQKHQLGHCGRRHLDFRTQRPGSLHETGGSRVNLLLV